MPVKNVELVHEFGPQHLRMSSSQETKGSKDT